ncbi:hypothetical protein K1719_002308 [Acacia pycnantha]|nr:hypothetical protein K1719_002308 [Acacia pycnantha]
MTESTTKPPTQFHFSFLLLHQLHAFKRSMLDISFTFPTSCFALLLLLFLLAYNGFTVFWVHVPFLLTKSSPSKPIVFPPVMSERSEESIPNLSSSVLFAIKDNSANFSKIHFPTFQNSSFPIIASEKFPFN